MRKDEGMPHAAEDAGKTNAEDMYRDHILEHYKHPRNFGVLDEADVDHEEDNPLCGDDIRITLKLDDKDRVADVRFQGRGCAISQASASLLTTRIHGMPIEEVKALSKEDVVSMLGIPVSPVRLKCALLSLVVLKDGLAVYEKQAKAG